MFATRDLPTCKMLIRKHAYIFMKSAAESNNVAALEKFIVCAPVLDKCFFFPDDLYGCNLSAIKLID